MTTKTGPRSMKILLANDGSSHAYAAIDLICNLPLPYGSVVHSIGVLVPRQSSNHAILENVLDDTEQLFKKRDIDVRSEIILGYPQEIIIQYADKFKPDLITVGAKGLRATLGILLGGVAQQVVEYSCCPVLVVRAPFHQLQNIAVVTDGSQYSQRAIEFLIGNDAEKINSNDCTQFPLPGNSNIKVIHVIPPMPSPELIARSWPMGTEIIPIYEPDEESEKEWMSRERPKGQAIIDHALSQFENCGIDVEGVLLWGDAATEIIEYSKEHNIDLIVAGSRGLSQMRGFLLGSVSRKLVHYSGCSVLIVKNVTVKD